MFPQVRASFNDRPLRYYLGRIFAEKPKSNLKTIFNDILPIVYQICLQRRPENPLENKPVGEGKGDE